VNPLQHFEVHLALFVLALVAIAVSNAWGMKRLGRAAWSGPWPRVAVLIPARDEERNIARCVVSLLRQDYPHLEIWVLDDHSTDDTRGIVAALQAQDGRLHLVEGKPLPPGWLGKTWACHQLAQRTSADLLLFVDADTYLHPQAVADAVAALCVHRADLLSALPRQEVGSWGERLVVPMLSWSIYTFLPLGIAQHVHWPAFSAFNGQFLLFRRQAYEQIGGHAAIRDQVVDDLALGRRLIAARLGWRLLDGSTRIRCRMYHSWREVREGLTKNLFAVFGHRLLPFVFVWVWLPIVFVWPSAGLVMWRLGWAPPGFSAPAATLTVFSSLLLWGLAYGRFRFPLYLIFLYPLSILLSAIIAFRSLAYTLGGATRWKGRPILRPSWRWF